MLPVPVPSRSRGGPRSEITRLFTYCCGTCLESRKDYGFEVSGSQVIGGAGLNAGCGGSVDRSVR